MSRWTTTIDGAAIREAINRYDSTPESAEKVLLELRKGLEPHTDIESVEEFLLTLDGEDAAFFTELEETNTFQEYYFNNLDEYIDSRLYEFWDICDREDIFVSILSFDVQAKEKAKIEAKRAADELKYHLMMENDRRKLFGD